MEGYSTRSSHMCCRVHSFHITPGAHSRHSTLGRSAYPKCTSIFSLRSEVSLGPSLTPQVNQRTLWLQVGMKVLYRHSPAVACGWHIGLNYAEKGRRWCFLQTRWEGSSIKFLLCRKTPGGKSPSRQSWPGPTNTEPCPWLSSKRV